MNIRKLLLFLPLIFVLGLGYFFWKGLSLNPRELPSALIGKPFPEFALTALHQQERVLGRKDLLGKPALVNVWATWCPACKTEHPWLLKIAREEGVPIYGINYKDDRQAAITWLREWQDPFVFTLFDSEGKLGFDLGVYGAPETYIIDAGGIVRYRYAGPLGQAVWDEMKVIYLKYLNQSNAGARG